MSAWLPPSLLVLFKERAPLEYAPPLDLLPYEKKYPAYTGIAQYTSLLEDPADAPPPTFGETPDERHERKRLERQERAAAELQQAIAAWDATASPEKKTTDPYKTLFVGRMSFETTESRLRRNLEQYGPIVKVTVLNGEDGKPRGYGFVEFEHERDMRMAYKHAEGMKIDGRRILVDVERGRTVKGWLPRRLGGGLGLTRRGGDDVNIKHGGREASQGNVPSDGPTNDVEERRDDRRDRDRRDSYAPSRDRATDRRGSYWDVDKPSDDVSKDVDKDRERDRDRGRDRGRDRDYRDKDRDRGRERDRDYRDKDRERER
eukprot:Ihof_evm1s571 gene=Ihof_evmTU1s571